MNLNIQYLVDWVSWGIEVAEVAGDIVGTDIVVASTYEGSNSNFGGSNKVGCIHYTHFHKLVLPWGWGTLSSDLKFFISHPVPKSL